MSVTALVGILHFGLFQKMDYVNVRWCNTAFLSGLMLLMYTRFFFGSSKMPCLPYKKWQKIRQYSLNKFITFMLS